MRRSIDIKVCVVGYRNWAYDIFKELQITDVAKLNNLGVQFDWVSIKDSEFQNKTSQLKDLKKETLEPVLNNLIKSNETNFKGVGQPLRIALTGSKFGPGIYDIIISLGKEEVQKRLRNKILS